MKSRILNFLARFRRKETLNPDERRVFLNTQLTCLTTILVSGVAWQVHFASGVMTTGYDMVSLAVAAVAVLILIYTTLTRHARYVTWPLILLLSIAGIYALSAGSDQTHMSLWLLTIPPVIMFNLGIKKGLIPLTGILLATALALLYPGFPTFYAYSAAYKAGYLSALFCAIFFSCGIEYARYQTQVRLQQLTEKLQQQACSDPLTNLANRRRMCELIKHERARSKRHKLTYSLVLADIDNFKKVNDLYGHNVGDAAISHTAQIFTRHLRQEDYIARWGGEEFLVLLVTTGTKEAIAVTERIRTTLMNSSVKAGDIELNITASFGIYTNDPETGYEKSIDQEIHEADMCLYAAKKGGKNQTVHNQTLENETSAVAG